MWEVDKMMLKRMRKNTLRAIKKQKKWWILPLSIGLGLLLVSVILQIAKCKDIADHMLNLGGWLLTLAGILFAGYQAAQIALTDAFAKLYEEESSIDQYYAKKLVCPIGRKVNIDLQFNNGYYYIKKRDPTCVCSPGAVVVISPPF
jgi:hypothetical protein